MKKHLIFCRIAAMLLACLLIFGTVVALPIGAAEKGVMSLLRPALELSLGEKDQIVPLFENVTGTPAVTYTSADPSIVTVDQDGRLEAKKVGKTTVTVACAATGDSIELSVSVIEKEHTFDDDIMITIFWPPSEGYLNDEQFKLMADAGITQVLGAHPDYYTVESQMKMLELCAKYGMGLTIEDGSGWNHQSEERIAELIKRYHNVPGAYGFFMGDEPFNANPFVSTYVGIKKQEPNAYIHLNFLPQGPYGSAHTYRAQMTDYARLCDEAGYPLDYLMFDSYPFGPVEGQMERAGFYSNIRSVYMAGLKNQVKTGLYIQTVGIWGVYRRPEDAAIRYEMYTALAYGCKQLSFFTWFTPVNRGEGFYDGIISPEGVPNAHYETIKQVNSEIHAIGPTLAKCDTLGVYFTGRNTYGEPAVPADFFAHTSKSTDNFIFSWKRHTETGRNYLMVVNNGFGNDRSVDILFDEAITGVSEVSRTDGSLQPLTMKGQKLTVHLEAGDAVLLAMPEDYDFYQAPYGQPAASVNLAANQLINQDASVNYVDNVIINASSSVGGDGYYIYNLNDGTRIVPGTSDEQSWRSVDNKDAYIKIDFGRELKFNRVDLYAAGNIRTFGQNFPRKVEVSVSSDGETWQSVKTFTDLSIQKLSGVRLDIGAQTARYVKLDMKDIPADQPYVALNEIEIYNDDGTVPDPDRISLLHTTDVTPYTEGENIALLKRNITSSYVFTNDWATVYVNDGLVNAEGSARGWSSAFGKNSTPDAEEWAGVEFGDLFDVHKLVIRPCGAFPEDYQVQVSNDGWSWTTISEETGANPTGDIVLTFDTPVRTRAVRILGTKLRAGSGATDGYVFQLGDIEAYGTPVCDKTVIETAMEIYRTEGGDTGAAEYKDAEKALANALLTQSQANDLAGKLYLLVGYNADGTKPAPRPLPPVETEPVTEPVTEPDTSDEALDTSEPPVATMPATETDVDLPKEGGCKSALAVGAWSLLSVGLAFLLMTCKRREKTST